MRSTSTLLLFLLTFLASNSYAYDSGRSIYAVEKEESRKISNIRRYPMWSGYNDRTEPTFRTFRHARAARNRSIVACYAHLNDILYNPELRIDGKIRECAADFHNDSRLDMQSWNYDRSHSAGSLRLDVYHRETSYDAENGIPANAPPISNYMTNVRREILFVLRGTSEKIDWANNVNAGLDSMYIEGRPLDELVTGLANFSKSPNYGYKVGYNRNYSIRYLSVEARVYNGWDDYFQQNLVAPNLGTIESAIEDALTIEEQWLATSGLIPHFKSLGIKITGHSLGAAASQLLGLILHKRYHDKAVENPAFDSVDVEVIAFDPPALGNIDLSVDLQRLINDAPNYNVHIFANTSDGVFTGMDIQPIMIDSLGWNDSFGMNENVWINSTIASSGNSQAEYINKKTYFPLFLRNYRAHRDGLAWGDASHPTIGMPDPQGENGVTSYFLEAHSYYKWSSPLDNFPLVGGPPMATQAFMANTAPDEVAARWFPIIPIGDRTVRAQLYQDNTYALPRSWPTGTTRARGLINVETFSAQKAEYVPGEVFPADRVFFRENGSLELLGSGGLWRSGTADQGATELRFTSSGRLEILKGTTVLWKSVRVSGATSIHYSEAEEALYWIGYDGARLAVIRPEFDDGFVEVNTNSPLEFVSASQKDTLGSSYGAEKAIDGNINGNSFTHTKTSSHTWWQGDFGKPKTVHTITLNNRSTCCTQRLQNFYIFITDVDMSGKTLSEIKDNALFSRYIKTPVSTTAKTKHYTSYDIGNGVQGRYVVIYKVGDSYLSLAEVKAEGRSFHQTNEEPELLTFKSALQKDTLRWAYNAEKAIDGNTDGNSFTHTKSSSHTWWQGDFGKDVKLSEVSLFNRTNCCAGRLDDFYMFVTNESVVGKSLEEIKAMASHEAYFSNPVPSSSSSNNSVSYPFEAYRDNDNATRLNSEAVGRYLVIYKKSKSYLSLAEVQVKGYYYE
jgi:hypothetical protein